MLKNRCQVQKSYSQGAARNGQSAGGYYSSSWSYYLFLEREEACLDFAVAQRDHALIKAS
jgi:hypothetical protein